MDNEIEEFLRRIARQKMREQQAGRQGNKEEALDAIVVDPGPTANLAESGVGAHMESHLDASTFGKQTAHLGAKIDQRDDRMDEHVHKVFDHELGALHSSSDKPVTQPAQAPEVASIVRMLTNPRMLRDAILLQEILGPPVSERNNHW